jgi:hypothetical protein
VAEAKGASKARMTMPLAPFQKIRPLGEDPNIRQACGSIRSLVPAARNSRAVVRRRCDRIAPWRQPSSRNSCSKPPRKTSSLDRSVGWGTANESCSTRQSPGRWDPISGTTDLSDPELASLRSPHPRRLAWCVVRMDEWAARGSNPAPWD